MRATQPHESDFSEPPRARRPRTQEPLVGVFEVEGRMSTETSATRIAATPPNKPQSHSANRGAATAHNKEWPSIGGQTCADTSTNRLAVQSPTPTPIGAEATLSASARRRIY